MTKIIILPVLIVISLISFTSAYAGCDPKCPEGSKCRYGGSAAKTYFCEIETKKGVKGGVKGIIANEPGGNISGISGIRQPKIKGAIRK